MKTRIAMKIAAAWLIALPLAVLAQTYPSPTFAQVTVVGASPQIKFNSTPLLSVTADQTSIYQLFFGYNAGAGNSIASVSTAQTTCIGTQSCGAGGAGLSVASTTAVGFKAANALATGTKVTALGANALGAATSGNGNVAIGYNAISQPTAPGNENIAIGDQSLLGASSSVPAQNIAIGFNAMGNSTLTNATNNIAIGHRNLQGITGGAGNISIGAVTGESITSGANNVVVGFGNASSTLSGGSYNLLLGNQLGTSTVLDAPSANINGWVNIQGVIAGGSLAATGSNLSSCGTSPSITAQSNDIRGTFTTGSATTACTFSFTSSNRTAAPTCVVTGRGGVAPTYTTSTSALTLSVAVASTTYDYICMGY